MDEGDEPRNPSDIRLAIPSGEVWVGRLTLAPISRQRENEGAARGITERCPGPQAVPRRPHRPNRKC